jgi:hypothetical protein
VGGKHWSCRWREVDGLQLPAEAAHAGRAYTGAVPAPTIT